MSRLFLTFSLTAVGLLLFASANEKPLQLFIGLFLACIGNAAFSIPLVSKIASESHDDRRGRALGAQAALDCGIGFLCVLYAGNFVHMGTLIFYPLFIPLFVRTILQYQATSDAIRKTQ